MTLPATCSPRPVGLGRLGQFAKGDTWFVSVAGTLGGQAVEVGDQITALIDAPGQTAGNWFITEHNLGYTPANDAAVVHLAQTETITGAKTFSASPTISATHLNMTGASANVNATNALSLLGSQVITTAGGVEAFRANSSAHLVPGADNARDLGLTGTRWRDLYLSTSVRVGNNPAAAGALRLANTQTVAFRNAANTADIVGLTLTAGDITQVNGGTGGLSLLTPSAAVNLAPGGSTVVAVTSVLTAITTAATTITASTATDLLSLTNNSTGPALAIQNPNSIAGKGTLQIANNGGSAVLNIDITGGAGNPGIRTRKYLLISPGGAALTITGGGLNGTSTLQFTTNNSVGVAGMSNTGMTNIGTGSASATNLLQVVQRTTGLGTVTTNGTVNLTGVGTTFTDTFRVGDTITVAGETVRTIATIPSDTSLTVTVAFSTTASGLAYTLTGGNALTVAGNGTVTVSRGQLVVTPNASTLAGIHLNSDTASAVGGIAFGTARDTTLVRASAGVLSTEALTISNTLTLGSDLILPATGIVRNASAATSTSATLILYSNSSFTAGAWAVMRGRDYTTVANQQGNLLMYADRTNANANSGKVVLGTHTGGGSQRDILVIDKNDDITLFDSTNLILGTATGTQYGTAPNQKQGWWGATPIVQPTTAVAAATFVANTSGIANDSATFDGYTIGQVVKALRNEGLLA